MGRCLLNKLFKRFVGFILYYADTEFLARSIGCREINSKVFWITKNIVQLIENAFGKEYFDCEYSDSKRILNNSDYLGIILKTNIFGDILTFYLKEIYLNNEYPEFTLQIETFIKNNIRKCFRLFKKNIFNYLRNLPGSICRFIIDRANLGTIDSYKRIISIIISLYKDKKVGVAVGFDRSQQMNYFKPIINAFIVRGIPFIHISEQESIQKKTEFIQREGFSVLKIRLASSKEVFRNRSYLDGFKRDVAISKTKILESNLARKYKIFIINRLDKHIKRYYKIRFFLDEFIENINIKFAFALPDRYDFQRTMLMLCKNRTIPTFTYEAIFNTSETVLAWYFFSDWVLLSNKKYVNMVVEKGFSKNRICQIGSTLADYYIKNNNMVANIHKDTINILILTKPLRRTGLMNDVAIDGVMEVMRRSGFKYVLYIKPHPSDKDSYSRYTNKYKDTIFLLDKYELIYKYISKMDALITCGLTGAIFECLPAKKPIIVVDLTSNADKKIFDREDLSKIVPLFQNLQDFKSYLTNLINNISKKNITSFEIPQSLIDDFYYSLDGKTKERIIDFVFSKIPAT